jgi:salicylate biosynthesis isochorismate synthase
MRFDRQAGCEQLGNLMTDAEMIAAAAARTAVSTHGPAGSIDPADVRRAFVAAHDAARRHSRPVLVAWARPLAGVEPRALLRRADRLGGRVFSWTSRWTGVESLGVGSSLDLSAEGADRFAVVRRAWRRYAGGLVAGGSGIAGRAGFPLLVGGFAFQSGRWHPAGGVPDSLTWCPAVQVVRLGDGSTHLALTARLTAGADPIALADARLELAARLLAETDERPLPDPALDGRPRLVARFDVPDAAQWRRAVGAAVDEIHRGDLTKVVLARQVVLHADRPFAVPAAVDRLAEGFSEGAVFAARFAGCWFLGGTPECLVRVAHGEVTAHSLAGSAARGATASADAAGAQLLLDNVKTRQEQAVVTDFVARVLAGVCVDVRVPARPGILRLGNVQHLVGTVTATVPAQRAVGVLDLVERLHPTPAVGGYPRPAALRWIARSEPFDRGWYAAPVGWLDAAQDGEMAVAIRSALVSGNRAALFAGCGIVAGSSPDDEYAETELKLRPMLTALDASGPVRGPGAAEDALARWDAA